MQEGARFKVGERYMRILETGNVYPIHEEREKMVRKGLAEFVVWNGKSFDVERQEPVEVKPVSTPARRPEPPQRGPTVAPVQTAPPVVKTFEAPKPSIDLGVGDPPGE